MQSTYFQEIKGQQNIFLNDHINLFSGIDSISSGQYAGLDCEMVGVGTNGERSVLARVCVVDGAGKIVLDIYAKPNERVTDLRTRISGITWDDVKHAEPIETVQDQVAEALRGKIVIGHSLKHDFAALNISHPADRIRDIAQYPPLMRPTGRGKMPVPCSLKQLAKIELGLKIQYGKHTPVDDARASLCLYAKHRSQWENYLRLTNHMRKDELLQFLADNPKWMPQDRQYSNF